MTPANFLALPDVPAEPARRLLSTSFPFKKVLGKHRRKKRQGRVVQSGNSTKDLSANTGRDMGRTLRQVSWITLFFGSCLFGCTKSAVRHKEPPDPLLVTKSPVEGRPHTTHASPLSRTEPTPPPPAPSDADAK
jgi:hypothetical protein